MVQFLKMSKHCLQIEKLGKAKLTRGILIYQNYSKLKKSSVSAPVQKDKFYVKYVSLLTLNIDTKC